MDPKPRPNHAEYIRALRRMTPQERLQQAFELSDRTRDLFEQGLRERFPDLPEPEFRALFLRRIALCHNANY